MCDCDEGCDARKLLPVSAVTFTVAVLLPSAFFVTSVVVVLLLVLLPVYALELWLAAKQNCRRPGSRPQKRRLRGLRHRPCRPCQPETKSTKFRRDVIEVWAKSCSAPKLPKKLPSRISNQSTIANSSHDTPLK